MDLFQSIAMFCNGFFISTWQEKTDIFTENSDSQGVHDIKGVVIKTAENVPLSTKYKANTDYPGFPTPKH